MAIQVVRELTADVIKRGSTRNVYAKQHDYNSRFLNVRVQEDGKDIVVKPTSTVILNVKRSDQASNMFYGTVNTDGTVRVPLTSWILEVAGSHTCDISIISEDPAVAKLTTMQFSIYVEDAVVCDENIPESTEYSVIIDLLTRTEEAAKEAEAAKKDAEASAKAAKEAAEANRGTVHVIVTSVTDEDDNVTYSSDTTFEDILIAESEGKSVQVSYGVLVYFLAEQNDYTRIFTNIRHTSDEEGGNYTVISQIVFHSNGVITLREHEATSPDPVEGSGGLLVVNVTVNETGVYTSDKSFAEIVEAESAGKVVQVELNVMKNSGRLPSGAPATAPTNRLNKKQGAFLPLALT